MAGCAGTTSKCGSFSGFADNLWNDRFWRYAANPREMDKGHSARMRYPSLCHQTEQREESCFVIHLWAFSTLFSTFHSYFTRQDHDRIALRSQDQPRCPERLVCPFSLPVRARIVLTAQASRAARYCVAPRPGSMTPIHGIPGMPRIRIRRRVYVVSGPIVRAWFRRPGGFRTPGIRPIVSLRGPGTTVSPT